METLATVTIIEYDELERLIQEHINPAYDINDDFDSPACYSCWLVRDAHKLSDIGYYHGSNLIRLVRKGVLKPGHYLVRFSW